MTLPKWIVADENAPKTRFLMFGEGNFVPDATRDVAAPTPRTLDLSVAGNAGA